MKECRALLHVWLILWKNDGFILPKFSSENKKQHWRGEIAYNKAPIAEMVKIGVSKKDEDYKDAIRKRTRFKRSWIEL